MDIYPPHTLLVERYEVIKAPDLKKHILVGGMGLVYICRDTKNDRMVALKTFRPEYLPNRMTRNRFLREGTTWVELGSHPNIVRCHEIQYVDPTAFLVLERIDGVPGRQDASLAAWMGVPMPIEQSLLFTLQIARGMQHAVHKIPGLVHRDLKPANVLAGADQLPGTRVNRLRVTDFGLVKILKERPEPAADGGISSARQMDLTHNIVGTPLYMAPEQWRNEEPGVYTDVYALGCILYEMLSGHPAAGGNNSQALREAHCSGKLNPLPGNITRQEADFIRQCLARDPGERFQFWSDVTAALEQMCAGRAVDIVPDQAEESESLEDRSALASSYNVLGISYSHLGNAREALTCFEKALDIYQATGDRKRVGSVRGNMGNAHVQLGQAQQALADCQQDLAIARELGDRKREAIALGETGEIHRQLGRIDLAIQSHEQRLEIVRALGDDRRGEGNTLGSLGLAYASGGNLGRAIDLYQQQLAIAHSIEDRRGEAAARCNLGNAYVRQGERQRALECYQQYLNLAHEIGDAAGMVTALGNLGNVYLSLGRLQSAEISFREQVGLLRELDDRKGLCISLFNLGRIYRERGLVNQSMRVFLEMYNLAREINFGEALQRLAALPYLPGWPQGLGDWEKLAQSVHEK